MAYEPVKPSITPKTIMSENDIKKILASRGVVNKFDAGFYNKFCRFGYFDPYTALKGTREYLFFTKPMLNLFSGSNTSSLNPDLAQLPFFQEMMSRYPDVLLQLKQTTRSPFMNILTNSVVSALDLPSVSSRDTETSANMYGSRLFYKRSSFSSDEQFDFSLEFQDSKYLEVYNLLKIYDEYERLKDLGRVGPEDIYRKNKILHDQFSIFKIIVDEDAESIVYYAKMTGVFFTSLPRETFSDTSGVAGQLKHSVSFKATFVEDMNPLIISDFNRIVGGPYNEMDPDIAPDKYNDVSTPFEMNNEWASMPYIVRVDAERHNYRYKLKWSE